jgi:hypothetical protein
MTTKGLNRLFQQPVKMLPRSHIAKLPNEMMLEKFSLKSPKRLGRMLKKEGGG